ncbi:actin-histidine N-methyltransferase [Euwallacea similis]|uniref:actin-histidine N-methyltransferase n=1 Tax=Euwallacea similis TaxID=1736056 RepID=UPI00344BBBE8
MGKKTQSQSQNNSNKLRGLNKKAKSAKEEKELLETVDSLLRLTTLPTHSNIPQSLECQKQIAVYLDRIKFLEEKLLKKQNKISASNVPAIESQGSQRGEETIKNFTKWLKENGAEIHGCSIVHFEGYDLGIRVDQDISQNSLVIAIPRKVMMSVESAKKSMVQDLLNKVEILKNMPNVLLTIYLLIEKISNNPFWRPYIDILPKSYNTVLTYTVNELEELKGSPTLEIALKQIKSIVRQYAYFHKLFWTMDDPVSELMKAKFTFSEYCWAVSTVMTRQNKIPSEDRSSAINALIPFWDLCNHSNGTISTDYNPELDRSECLAFRDFKVGEQLFIFYGPRSNSDFFIHNGFVYEENENDIYWIRLGISKSDPLQEKRRELLDKLEIWSIAEFCLKKGANPVDGRLLAFLRVFNMDEEKLDHWLKSEKVLDLQHPDCSLDTALEKKSWTFLETRLNLLLASYKTKIDEDRHLLSSEGLSENARLAIRMRFTEKKLLNDCLQYVHEMMQK